MKNAKKIVLGGVCALALVTGSVMGTMAYLTSKTEAVENTFTVGNVAITLDEANTDENGTTTSGRGNGNRYKLMPGHTYTKDPTVHVAEGSEDCYLFVTVKDDLAAIEDTTTTVADQIIAKGWRVVETTNKNEDEVVYVYTNNTDKPVVVNKSANVDVFSNLKIKSDATADTLKNYGDKKITVKAYAIQSDGIADTTAPSDIWDMANN